ncbi:MAG: hypothetical protein HYZ75_00460 [Elusimicrobia bacterium]|nr:hypothetical protein [Elusimicrobiota bacterium]
MFAMPPIPPMSTSGGKPSTGGAKKKDDDKGGAVAPLPMWSSAPGDKLAGMPMFRGASMRTNSLLGRLRNLKTKDVAFIGAGLAVLIMAPLAEYLVSESGDSAATLTPGFDQKGGVFPNGSDPAEMGIQQLARGGLLGENPDVITPANYRDPSSLIMAFGGEKQEPPPAATPTPDVKRDAPKDNVWDRVVDSAKAAGTSVSRKVGLPKPGGKLAGALSGLRGLASGSSGAKSNNLAAPDSKGLFSSPRGSNALTQSQAIPGYRGAGARSMAAGSGGNGFDGRRGGGSGSGGGGQAGDVTGGGVSGGGKVTGGSAADGDPTKNPSGSSTKDNKALGENLEFLRRKMLMEKEMDLKFAKRRYDELERKKMIEQTLVQTAQQAFLKILDKLLEGKKKEEGGGGGGGGGPSGGAGGAPTGPKPKDDTALPSAGNLGSGLGRMAEVRAVENKDGAQQQLEASKAKKVEVGTSLNTLTANAGFMKTKADLLKTGDTDFKALGGMVQAAADKVTEAKAKLGTDLDQVNQPLADHQTQITAVKSDKEGKLDTLATKIAPLPGKVNAELVKLTEASGNLTSGGASKTAYDEARNLRPTADGARRPANPNPTPAPEPREDARAMAAAIRNMAGPIETKIGAMITSMGTVSPDPGTLRTLTEARTLYPNLVRDAASNVEAAGRNVQTGLAAVTTSRERVISLEDNYGIAQQTFVNNTDKLKDMATASDSAIAAYELAPPSGSPDATVATELKETATGRVTYYNANNVREQTTNMQALATRLR